MQKGKSKVFTSNYKTQKAQITQPNEPYEKIGDNTSIWEYLARVEGGFEARDKVMLQYPYRFYPSTQSKKKEWYAPYSRCNPSEMVNML